MSHERTLPLDRVGEGVIVELVGMRPSGRASRRLAELGLLPKTKITVLKATHGQPLIIKVRGSKLAIDRQTAHHIRVRRIWGAHGRYREARRHRAWRRGWRRRFWRRQSWQRGWFAHRKRRHKKRWFQTVFRTFLTMMWGLREWDEDVESEDGTGTSERNDRTER